MCNASWTGCVRYGGVDGRFQDFSLHIIIPDCSAEEHSCAPGKDDVPHRSFVAPEFDMEILAAACQHMDGRPETELHRCDQRAGDRTGAAGECFILDAPLVRPHGYPVGAEELHEVHVCPLCPELRVVCK